MNLETSSFLTVVREKAPVYQAIREKQKPGMGPPMFKYNPEYSSVMR